MPGKKRQHANGSPQGGRRPTEGDPLAERGRYSSSRKVESVLRVLRSGDLDSRSRDLGVTAATLSEWRDGIFAAGGLTLSSSPPTSPKIAFASSRR